MEFRLISNAADATAAQGGASDASGRLVDLRAGRDTLPEFMKSKFSASVALLAVGVFSAGFWNPRAARAANMYVPFEGEKTTWHDGFDRYDYVMDEETLAITPFKRPDRRKVCGRKSGERPAAVHCGRAEASRARPSVVVAGLLLGSRAADRSRIAPARFSHRLHHATTPASSGTRGMTGSRRNTACRRNRPSSA